MALIALMMVSALAGCLGNDDDDTDDSSNTNNNTDTGNNTTTPVTTTPVETGIDVGTVTCGPDGSIKIAGSSTVLPLAEIWAEYYQENCEGVTITVESGGSGGGAGRVCANSAKGTPVDIGDMSRDWKSTEANRGVDGYTMDCLAGDTSRSARQIQVAIDGLSVVMKSGGAADVCVNTHLGGLTVDQLRWMFSAEADTGYTPANDDGDA
ncbi:MAG: substrate-binding domain-containing protein, partial [Candidatus Poseidonia sp.]|nr:substrate-binding domain-containing protein [Poseidonia sp.]